MLALQPHRHDPTALGRATRNAPGSGNGWLIFWIMSPLVTLVAGYIVGRERAYGRRKGKRKRPDTSAYPSAEEYEDWLEST